MTGSRDEDEARSASDIGIDFGDLTTVGWREWVSLPDWGVDGVRAKIDTGARTSAIHVAQIEELGEDRIRFEVVLRESPRETVWVESELARVSAVKPSSGEVQERPVVLTHFSIGDVAHDIELSLVCRQGMLCRMLVGRTALAGHFVVDPSRTHIATPKRRKKRRRRSR